MSDSLASRQYIATTSDGDKIHLCVRKPTRSEIEAADLAYASAFNKSIRAGIPPRIRMLKDLKNEELWLDTDSEDLDAKRQAAIKANEDFDKAKEAGFESPGVEKRLTKERDEANKAFQERFQEFEAMMRHTADSRADVASRNFIVACTTEYDDVPENGEKAGDRVWNSVAELSEADAWLMTRATYESQVLRADQESEWEEPVDEAETGDEPTKDPISTDDVTEPEAEAGDVAPAEAEDVASPEPVAA